MKSVWTMGMVAALGLILIVGRPSYGDDGQKNKANQNKANQNQAATHTANKPVAGQPANIPTTKPMATAASKQGNLPHGWEQLILAPEQQQKIAAVRHRYDAQIQQLTAQLAELKKTRHTEMTAVLTDQQKEQLAGIAATKNQSAKNQPAKMLAEHKTNEKKEMLGNGKLALKPTGPDLSKIPTIEQLKERAAKEQQEKTQHQESKAKTETKPSNEKQPNQNPPNNAKQPTK